MNRLKKMFYAGASASLLAPSLVLAQWGVGSNTGGTGLNEGGTIGGTLNTLLNGLLGLTAVLAIIGFVVAGIMYITAAGDEGQIDKAKKILIFSIVGLVVALIGFILVNAINAWLVEDNTGF